MLAHTNYRLSHNSDVGEQIEEQNGKICELLEGNR